MATLRKIVKLTQEQYDILAAGGTVGGLTGLDENYLYLVEDPNADYIDNVIDIGGGITAEHRAAVKSNPAIVINYAGQLYHPADKFGYDSLPGSYFTFDTETGILYWLGIDWENLEISDESYYPVRQQDITNYYTKLQVDEKVMVTPGTGTNGAEQKADTASVDFTGRNPNAQQIDPTIAAEFIPGASGESAFAANGNTMSRAKRAFTNGNKTLALGEESHAEGYQSVTFGDGSHAEGNRCTAYGDTSHAEGDNTVAAGDNSHSEGLGSRASNMHAHAEGDHTNAEGYASHTEGLNTFTGLEEDIPDDRPEDTGGGGGGGGGDQPSPGSRLGSNAHAEGYYSAAAGNSSHAEGYVSDAIGLGSHAEGGWNRATGELSHVQGKHNESFGYCSFAGGLYNTASEAYQTVLGRYSVQDSGALFIIGNGTAENARSNAFVVKADGSIQTQKIFFNSSTSYISGDQYSGIGISIANNTKFLVRESTTYINTNLYPLTNGSRDIGTSGAAFHDIWMTGKLDLGKKANTHSYNSKIEIDNYDGICLYCNNVASLKVYDSAVFYATDLKPLGNGTTDIGDASHKVRNLYLSNSLIGNPHTFSDGGFSMLATELSDGLYFMTYGNCSAFVYISRTMLASSSTDPIQVAMPVIYGEHGESRPGILKITQPDPNALQVNVNLKDSTGEKVRDGFQMYIFRTGIKI